MFYEGLDANVVVQVEEGDHGTPYCDDFDDDSSNCLGPLTNNMLEFLLTNLKEDPIEEWFEADSDWESHGVLRPFWQPNFDESYIWQTSSLSPLGYVFYPDQCVDGSRQCKLHIWLHGCSSTARGGDVYDWGPWFPINGFAAANDLVVLYPDVQSTFWNLQGCFDTTGYSGGRYQTRDSL